MQTFSLSEFIPTAIYRTGKGYAPAIGLFRTDYHAVHSGVCVLLWAWLVCCCGHGSVSLWTTLHCYFSYRPCFMLPVCCCILTLSVKDSQESNTVFPEVTGHAGYSLPGLARLQQPPKRIRHYQCKQPTPTLRLSKTFSNLSSYLV